MKEQGFGTDRAGFWCSFCARAGAAITMAEKLLDFSQPFDVVISDATVASPLPLQISNPSQQAYVSELLSFNLERLHKVCNCTSLPSSSTLENHVTTMLSRIEIQD